MPDSWKNENIESKSCGGLKKESDWFVRPPRKKPHTRISLSSKQDMMQQLQVFVLTIFISVSCCLVTDAERLSKITYPADVEALKQLRAAVDNVNDLPASCLASWNFDHDPCGSISTTVFICGFRCSNQASPMRVTEITLDNVRYSGKLSPYIGNLSCLQVLDVSSNAFHGAIPESFSNLRSLRKLELSQNFICGHIPASLGRLSKLQYLSLGSNLLEGPLPASLNRLHALERLTVFNNRLSGRIPPLNFMINLLYFDGSSNQFSGWLPTALPVSILELSLRMNSLEGRLPKMFTFLKQLEVLDLSHNHLTGPVEASLFTLPSLQQLNLAYNQFEYLVEEPSVAECDESELVEIDLSFNKFQGGLPVFFVQMKRLTALSLGHNAFSGLIPIEYALKSVRMLIGAEPLLRLYLEFNFLAGELPSPFLSILPGEVAGSFVQNCLQNCPSELSFCQGGQQRPPSECSKLVKTVP